MLESRVGFPSALIWNSTVVAHQRGSQARPRIAIVRAADD
jgi:hypothetical protein